MIKISLIIPCFNKENFIKDCILSAVNSDFKEFEIIVIDDGSTDKSAEILDELAKIYANLKVIHQKNLGSSVARNVGLNLAKGEFIAFLDADDLLFKNALKELYKKANGADIVLGDYITFKNIQNFSSIFNGGGQDSLIQTNNIKFLKSYNVNDGILNKNIFFKKFCVRNSHFAVWGKLYKRKFLEQNSIKFLPSVFLGDDLFFNTQAFYFAKNIVKTSIISIAYRIEISNNLSRKLNLKNIKDARKIAKNLEKFDNIYIKALILRLKYEIVLNANYKKNFCHDIYKLPFKKEFYLLSLRLKVQILIRILFGNKIYYKILDIAKFLLKK